MICQILRGFLAVDWFPYLNSRLFPTAPETFYLKVTQPLFLGLQMIHLKSFFSQIADMLKVVRCRAWFTAAIQVRLPTNAATNADFRNYIGQQTC